MNTIIKSFIGPRFDLGYPEHNPTFRQLPNREIEVRKYGEAHPGVETPIGTRSAPAE